MIRTVIYLVPPHLGINNAQLLNIIVGAAQPSRTRDRTLSTTSHRNLDGMPHRHHGCDRSKRVAWSHSDRTLRSDAVAAYSNGRNAVMAGTRTEVPARRTRARGSVPRRVRRTDSRNSCRSSSLWRSWRTASGLPSSPTYCHLGRNDRFEARRACKCRDHDPHRHVG